LLRRFSLQDIFLLHAIIAITVLMETVVFNAPLGIFILPGGSGTLVRRAAEHVSAHFVRQPVHDYICGDMDYIWRLRGDWPSARTLGLPAYQPTASFGSRSVSGDFRLRLHLYISPDVSCVFSRLETVALG
jgi:hypothetical protein